MKGKPLVVYMAMMGESRKALCMFCIQYRYHDEDHPLKMGRSCALGYFNDPYMHRTSPSQHRAASCDDFEIAGIFLDHLQL